MVCKLTRRVGVGRNRSQALFHPRLLVPVVTAGVCSGWNHFFPFSDVHFELGFVFLGFLTYKTSVLLWTYNEDLKPWLISLVRGDDDKKPQARPTVLSSEAFDELARIRASQGKDNGQ